MQQPQAPPDLALAPIIPEMVLVGVGMVILIVDGVWPARRQGRNATLAMVGILGAGLAAVQQWLSPPDQLTVLGGMVATDRFAAFFRLVVLASAALAVLLATQYLERTGEGRGEFYALVLFSASGMTLLAAAADLIVVFLALEVLSLSLYVMAGFSRRRLASQEASMKYFLLGSFSSAFFLYGIALTYGATGTTSIAGIAEALGGETGNLALAFVGAALLAVGFAFKVAAVPFHMWTPDVYQGAPTPVTGFMAAGTKVAGFAALIRVTTISLGPLGWELTPALYVLSALTMVVGSVLAIAQDDVKRMLAYSSIAHAGFVLVGVTALNQQGISGSMFYLAAYAAMILGAFGVAILVSRTGEERTSLSSYRGLAHQSPVLAALLTLFLLSLAGLPPAAGFMAKFVVFQAAVQAGHVALVLIAVLASVVAAFFYIRVIVLMYMAEAEAPVPLPTPAAPATALAVAAAVTLVLGVFPALLLDPLQAAGVLRW